MCAKCAGAWFADPLLSLSALRVSDSDAEALNRRYTEVTPKWIARQKAKKGTP